MSISVGIHAIGTYLPEIVRTNEYWSPELLRQWTERSKNSPVRAGQPAESTTEGMRLAREAMAALRDDPFKGVRERRVMPPGMKPSDMEIAAAQDALSRSSVSREDIDWVLCASQVADNVMIATAPLVHRALELRPDCLSTNVTSMCNGFFHQLEMVLPAIASGRIRYALLCQSSAITRLHNDDDFFSPWFGDGATAVLVGPVASGQGVLALTHFTDGNLYDAMLLGSPKGPWYERHPAYGFVSSGENSRRMTLGLADLGKTAIDAALKKAGVRAEEISFLATHQGTGWLRPVTQKMLGLEQVKCCDTYPFTASIGPANVPFSLGTAHRKKALVPGDIVAAWAGGAGITYSGMILRWSAPHENE
jgi:3-oxoacyl-[acyl-carrier-protein] synthase-3